MNKSVSIPFNKSLHGYWCSKVLNPPLEPMASISTHTGDVWRTNNLAFESRETKKACVDIKKVHLVGFCRLGILFIHLFFRASKRIDKQNRNDFWINCLKSMECDALG